MAAIMFNMCSIVTFHSIPTANQMRLWDGLSQSLSFLYKRIAGLGNEIGRSTNWAIEPTGIGSESYPI